MTNAGPLTAPGVKVTTTLPAGLALGEASAVWVAPEHGAPGDHGNKPPGTGEQGGGEDEEEPPAPPTVTVEGGVVTADFGDFVKGDMLAVGGTVTVVARGVAEGTHSVSTGVVLTPTAEQPEFYDPLSENDTASLQTTVSASAPAPADTAAGGAAAAPSGATPKPATSPAPASGGAPAPVVVGGRACTVVGTPGDDVVVGTPGPDVICGLGGDDQLVGLGGRDLLIGGAGNDWLSGGAGNDLLDGGPGNDVLNAGTGSDVMLGRAGADVLSHVSGVSRAYGGPGDDRIVSVDDHRDWVNGGAGRDSAYVDRHVDGLYSVERVR